VVSFPSFQCYLAGGSAMVRRYWIQHAIKRKGALKQHVQRKYGSKGFTSRGTIKREVLQKEAKQPGTTGKRARLALTLRRIRKQ
jgi:hypothetical protein